MSSKKPHNRGYIPFEIRERAKQFHHLGLPLPVNQFKTQKNVEHLKANDRIYTETSAALIDYGVTTEEVREVWAIWEDMLTEVMTDGAGRSLRFPYIGTISPIPNKAAQVRNAFPEILRDFFKPGKRIKFEEWALRSEAELAEEQAFLEEKEQQGRGRISLSELLLMFAEVVEEYKRKDREAENGTAEL